MSVRMNSPYNIQTLEKLIRDPSQRKKFLNAYLKKALPPEECAELLPGGVQCLEKMGADSACLEIVERHDSQIDGASKLVFQTRDKHRIEAVVLRIASGRTSLCISSQIGCAAGCGFCATGKLGFIRNLTSQEMLDQVLLARRLLREEGRMLRNVVVMGMGEPLHNEENLFQCLEILRDPLFFNLSENHLLVSTVGIPDAMVRFAERFPKIRLALSLHSARQEVRETLMPVAKIQTLEKLRAVFPILGNTSGFMVEYLMLKGINDGPKDLEALKEFLSGTDAHINLIQFNAHPGAEFQPVSKEEREAFGEQLRAAGFKTTLRYSLGDDIAAACGQLAGK
ncbi:23S rRNA (adenine(2503)-C(2))-methyltransferase RlmN [Tichowtungia aerotolerans]|uniref:Radical SAM protein n=1 Tax=Tichowtungia aerotolerans TaxID=2697043 RepID=A0A6P1M9P0_9BACT|nr:23S rRNA (adenine(2503)-C(2))-methyltransferase RlmN [Tichowtungia aerotolerans]QHI70752.1 radical SAM protein [Tichowtungia aerotolerans]